jgi:hypothetical protein
MIYNIDGTQTVYKSESPTGANGRCVSRTFLRESGPTEGKRAWPQNKGMERPLHSPVNTQPGPRGLSGRLPVPQEPNLKARGRGLSLAKRKHA